MGVINPQGVVETYQCKCNGQCYLLVNKHLMFKAKSLHCEFVVKTKQEDPLKRKGWIGF